jgi:hypothetical protein
MNEFDDRKRLQEKKFELDQEQEFKAQARRAKLLGQWAAGELGLEGDEAAAYAKNMVIADLEEAGDEDLFRQVRSDFDKAAVAISDHVIRTKMAELLDVARAQVKEGI